MIEITKKSNKHLHVACSSKFEYLDPIVDESEAFVASHIEDPEFAYKIVLLVSEAATNAIEHGNAGDEEKHVRIDLIIEEKKVQITVEDEGEGFDPAAVRNPTDEQNLLFDSGRGIFFIEEIADKVTYELNGRRIHIFFNRISRE